MGLIKNIFSAIFDFLQGIVVILAIMVMIYLFIMSPQEINGASMEPNFHNKEFILTNKIEYKLHDPKRGEVVIFKSPRNKDIDYIKRIIGEPGDTVGLKGGNYYVNGTKLDEPYLTPGTYISGGNFLREDSETIVPKGRYFVSGDNRGHSSDSREFGPIPKEDFIGKAFLRYWPFSEAGLIQQPTYVLP
ncbi:MAG: signal peptidase I [Candidatus Gottesmanbacteria bacterium]|nr:signal peptidase I [Candidatus Gottesmanbacteria bacterium]